ncbi:hypothetical protein K501DRAFT_276913 [Backusella circina FSU 941]|nr:hypothetical protein K501DRAFT_276913 [Backusella circina FSU 941]
MSTVNNVSYYSTNELVEILKKDNLQIDNKLIERVKANDDKALCLIGEKYYHNKDHLKAMIWFLKSAYFNNSSSQYYIGRIFETGTDSPINKRQALEWYQRSADQANRLAKTRIVKLKWKGYSLDSNQKAFINLERKTDELKRNYLDKIEDLEQRYQANLKVLDYEKLSFEFEKTKISNLKPIQESDEFVYTQLELLDKKVQHKMERLEMKNQLLEDSIKILEKENLLNQEAFEKEKRKAKETFEMVQMEYHQLQKEENIIKQENKDVRNRLAQIESTTLDKQQFDDRLIALEDLIPLNKAQTRLELYLN